MKPKLIWASKTFWANLIGGAAMVATAAGVEVIDATAQAQLVGGIMVVVNILLRRVTHTPVNWKKGDIP